jgi:hypothetical protein
MMMMMTTTKERGRQGIDTLFYDRLLTMSFELKQQKKALQANFTDMTPQKNICFLISLPSEVIRLVAHYFLKVEDHEEKVFPFCHDWRNFMNTSKTYFGKWKKESQVIVLKYPYALSFYQCSKIRQQVLNSIEDPRKQLDLGFINIDPERSVDLESILHVRSAGVSNGKVIPCSVDFDEIILMQCNFTDNSLQYYSRVKRFYFNDESSNEVFDLEPLQHLETGFFCIPRCVNYHHLGNLKALEITGCLSIKDVSCFRNIPKLTLSRCQNIRDVSSLSDVRELDLSFNKHVTDVSALGRVPVLRLNSCKRVRDVSQLNHVRTLDISYTSTADLSGLHSVEILNISGCSYIGKVTGLSTLKELNMKYCIRIEELTGLPNLKKLETEKILSGRFRHLLRHLTEFFVEGPFKIRSVPGVRTAPQPNYFSYLENITVLDIQEYQFPPKVNFPSFASLRSLTLVACTNIPVLPLLPALGHLSIFYCPGLKSLHIPGSPDLHYPIYTLDIQFCGILRDVCFDRKISDCRIHECAELKRVYVRSPIDLLKFYFCAQLQRIINKSLIVTTVVVGSMRDQITEKRHYGSQETDILIAASSSLKK